MLGFSKHSLQSEFTRTAYVVLTDERHEIRVKYACMCSECFTVLQVSTLVLQYVSGALLSYCTGHVFRVYCIAIDYTTLAVRYSTVLARVCRV